MSSDADPTEAGRRAAAVNHLLGQIGLTAPEQSQWWNRPFEELLGRTPTQAWLAGDIDDVKVLIDKWYEASEVGARAVSSDPARLDHLRAQLARLEERIVNRRLPTA